ncbi:phage baseplate assembly protein V [Escherichia coli]
MSYLPEWLVLALKNIIQKFGRVKIRFLWGKCPRQVQRKAPVGSVYEAWSGDGFGSQFIPRIGSEVLVSFIQGNPDYPIVVGTVYNGQNKPPFSLPENNCKSEFVTRSVKNEKGRGSSTCF